jgi:hypothetical protein
VETAHHIIYDRAMREDDRVEENITQAGLDADRDQPPVAYIPACGTLCDAFWWARRSDPKKPSD